MPYVLVCEGRHIEPRYFIRLGLGLFWECSHNVKDARAFTTRASAAKVLHANGKHTQGWRVVGRPIGQGADQFTKTGTADG